MVAYDSSWASWEVFQWRIQPDRPVSFSALPVLSRKLTPRSSKSIATHCGQMTSRLVWRPTSFHNMWPGLLNWRQGLREKIFPCTKSNLAAGGLWSCERAASTARERSIFPPTKWLLCTSHWFRVSVVSRDSSDVSSISTAAPLKNHSGRQEQMIPRAMFTLQQQ